MCLNQIFELSMVLDHEKFHKILNRAYKRVGYLDENEGEYIDQSMAAKGIVVKYRDSPYKKKVAVIINTKLVDSNAIDTERVTRKVDKYLKEYFEYKYQMEDFRLARLTLSADIDVGTQKNVSAYLKVMQRIGKVKGFSPSSYDCLDESSSFCLDGNSNGIEFLIYNLQRSIIDCLRKTETGSKKVKSAADKAKGLLRAEVRLIKPKVIRFYTDTTNVSEQIIVLSKNCRDIFLETFTRIVPFGDFYKKDRAAEIVRSEVENSTLRRGMLQLLTLIPEKKSLYLAQKEMNCRNVEKVMDEFAKINVSPVTISKRHDVKHLECFYEHIFRAE